MKKLTIAVALACTGLVGLSSSAWAEKPTEDLLYHCGCESSGDGTAEATSGLVWHEIIVSSNSKGHRKHLEEDEENCTYVDESQVTQDNFLQRGFNDVQDDGNEPALDGVDTCEDGVDCPTDGDSCELEPDLV